MDTSQQVTQAMQQKVFTYQSEQNIYAIGFSTRGDQTYRLALCTFSQDVRNLYQIIQLNNTTGNFQRKASFYNQYPANKVIWLPDQNTARPDILATSGDHIKIWQVKDRDCKQISKLIPNTKLSAPLTSFDWNVIDTNLIATSSIDTSCTIWDLQRQTISKQFLTKADQVYDISFSYYQRDIFAQVSGDGSLNQFDLRDLKSSNPLLYKTNDGNPLIKLAWNRKDCTYIGLIQMDKSYITLIDRRKLQPYSKLNHHRDNVNAICWAPHSSTHICSVGDDKQALIWDLSNHQEVFESPLLQYAAEEPISNLCWSVLQSDWLSICYSQYLQILKV